MMALTQTSAHFFIHECRWCSESSNKVGPGCNVGKTRLQECLQDGQRRGYYWGCCGMEPSVWILPCLLVGALMLWLTQWDGYWSKRVWHVFFHYLDDFLIIGAPSSGQCEEYLRILLVDFERLNIPVAMEKLEGPTTALTFLGIEMDMWNSTLYLPTDKL